MSSMHRRSTAALSIVLALPACATSSMTVTPSSSRALYASPRILTHEELDAVGNLPLDVALRRVRPELLRYRGNPVLIYVDGHPASGAELHDLSADRAARVRLLSPVEAALEYGALYGRGAILDVRLRTTR